ncbi:hypothetical protein CB0940_08188 [Cercospora beticola]|uniref:FAD dependent oxidoreductase domain-containing protein n=1 Tax=Cercospora beticola TaxID=122368 RepID=A0A2G5HP25_CERBT|nr:hypothetical protein CB0940_08188 [Cercospora beticola]PIA94294.1 hypothetical protein CB0940_08188 [Cercospora beticola]WPB04755.1 hypothetical protein RHO25_009402 [Cercospora beticola]
MSRQTPNLPTQRKPCDLPSEQSSKSFWHSEPSSLLLGHRSTRDLPETADLVVVGSGISGASIAHHLLNDGDTGGQKPHVVMLEAREACWGATGRNGGHCQPIFFEHPNKPEIGRFELANFQALDKLIKEKSIDCEFVVQPGVRGIYSEHHLKTTERALETIKTTAPDLSSMMRMVTSKKELDGLRLPTALGAVVTDVAARMWPYKFVCRILEDLLTSSDLDGLFNLQTLTPVTKILPCDTGVDVHTARGTIRASKVVLATNAYTSHLVPAFSNLIVPCRGQMSSLIPFPSVAGENRLKTSFGFLGDGLDDYLIQRPSDRGEHLMFGGGRQHGPSIGVTDDSVVDPKTAHYLRSRLIEAFQLPESEDGASQTYEMEATHEWSGVMGFSRDDLPWVGRIPNAAHTYISAGFTGHGMPNTWLSGKALALLVSESLTHKRNEIESLRFIMQKTGLPDSYLASEERIKAALQLEDVEARDWAEMQRGRGRFDPEYQAQLELLEQHCLSRLGSAVKEPQVQVGSKFNDKSNVRIPPPVTKFCGQTGSADGNDALRDYQLQLVLLDCQNKRRLLWAKREQASRGQLNAQVPAPQVPTPTQLSKQAELSGIDFDNAMKEYKKQMRLLDRQDGMELLTGSREQEPFVDSNTHAQNITQPLNRAEWELFRGLAERRTSRELALAEPRESHLVLVEKNEQGKFELPHLFKRQLQVLEKQRRHLLKRCALKPDAPWTLEYLESHIEILNLRPNTGASYEIQWETPLPSNPVLEDFHKQAQVVKDMISRGQMAHCEVL